MLQTALDILWPVADVLVRIKDQVHRTGHVMLALALAHIVHCAIILVRVIRYMIVFFVARHFVRCKIYFRLILQSFCYLFFTRLLQISLIVEKVWYSFRGIILLYNIAYNENVTLFVKFTMLYIDLLTILSSIFSTS